MALWVQQVGALPSHLLLECYRDDVVVVRFVEAELEAERVVFAVVDDVSAKPLALASVPLSGIEPGLFYNLAVPLRCTPGDGTLLVTMCLASAPCSEVERWRRFHDKSLGPACVRVSECCATLLEGRAGAEDMSAGVVDAAGASTGAIAERGRLSGSTRASGSSGASGRSARSAKSGSSSASGSSKASGSTASSGAGAVGKETAGRNERTSSGVAHASSGILPGGIFARFEVVDREHARVSGSMAGREVYLQLSGEAGEDAARVRELTEEWAMTGAVMMPIAGAGVGAPLLWPVSRMTLLALPSGARQHSSLRVSLYACSADGVLMWRGSASLALDKLPEHGDGALMPYAHLPFSGPQGAAQKLC
jgi:hypothetical protein